MRADLARLPLRQVLSERRVSPRSTVPMRFEGEQRVSCPLNIVLAERQTVAARWRTMANSNGYFMRKCHAVRSLGSLP